MCFARDFLFGDAPRIVNNSSSFSSSMLLQRYSESVHLFAGRIPTRMPLIDAVTFSPSMKTLCCHVEFVWDLQFWSSLLRQRPVYFDVTSCRRYSSRHLLLTQLMDHQHFFLEFDQKVFTPLLLCTRKVSGSNLGWEICKSFLFSSVSPCDSWNIIIIWSLPPLPAIHILLITC